MLCESQLVNINNLSGTSETKQTKVMTLKDVSLNLNAV